MTFLSVLSVYTTSLAFFFFNDTATTEIYTLSLHDALPISAVRHRLHGWDARPGEVRAHAVGGPDPDGAGQGRPGRSEEHTSELQSLAYLVCRLLLEKKKKKQIALLVSETTASGGGIAGGST